MTEYSDSYIDNAECRTGVLQLTYPSSHDTWKTSGTLQSCRSLKQPEYILNLKSGGLSVSKTFWWFIETK